MVRVMVMAVMFLVIVTVVVVIFIVIGYGLWLWVMVMVMSYGYVFGNSYGSCSYIYYYRLWFIGLSISGYWLQLMDYGYNLYYG